MKIIKTNKLNNTDQEYCWYDCKLDLICHNFDIDVEDFKVMHIDEDQNGNVFLMCRKEDFKFKIEIRNFQNYFYIECSDGEYKSYNNMYNVSKLFFSDYREKWKELKRYDGILTFETDIKNSYRFSINYIDKFKIEEDSKKYRILYFDIETRSSLDVINTPEPIISISYIDSFSKDKVFYVWHENIKSNEIITENNNIKKLFCSEKEMLDDFMNEYQKFDIITGFNIVGFDIIYLYNRLNKIGLDGNRLSPVGRVYNRILVDDDRFFGKNFKVFGIDVMDMRVLIKDLIKFSLNKPTNLTLEKVSKFYLGDLDKIKMKKSITKTWEDFEFDDLSEYNIRDVEILERLNEKLNIFFYYVNTRKILHSLNLVETQYNSIIIDKMILKAFGDRAFPTKKYSEKIDLEGAYVMEPIHGIYNNVGVFDFNSLYPNIIRTFNISPDSIVDKPSSTTINVNGVFFDSKFEALLPTLINKLIEQRYIYKKMKTEAKTNEERKVYDSIETSFKAVVNSVYGVFGLNSFRLYDVRVSSSITYMGRTLVQEMINYIDNYKDKNFKSVAGDTDSAFVYEKTKEQDYNKLKQIFEKLEKDIVIKMQKYTEDLLPEGYKDRKKNMNAECETIFKKIILPKAKKKYIGVVKLFKGRELSEETIYGRNVEIIKRDTPDSLKVIINKLMRHILYIDDEEILKDKLKEIKKEIYSLTYKDLLITKQINREFDDYKVIPQHVRSMKYSNKYLKTNFSRDNYRGGMLFVKKDLINKYPKTDVIMLDEDTELPEDFKIDYDKYYDLFIKRKLLLLNEKFDFLFNKNQKLSAWGITKQNFQNI